MRLRRAGNLDEFSLRQAVKQEGVTSAVRHGSVGNACKKAGVGAIRKSAQYFSLSALPRHRYGKVSFCRQLLNEPHHQSLCRLRIEDAFLFGGWFGGWEYCDQ